MLQYISQLLIINDHYSGIPNPQKIHLVVGKCIDMPKIEGDISQQDIDKYHTMFLEELEALFERHKHGECGYSNRKLVFK